MTNNNTHQFRTPGQITACSSVPVVPPVSSYKLVLVDDYENYLPTCPSMAAIAAEQTQQFETINITQGYQPIEFRTYDTSEFVR